MSNYITIQDAVIKYGKSQATLRRIATKLKSKKTTNIRFEPLSTGHKRILFSEQYLDNLFNYSATNQSARSDSSMNNSSVIEILHEQLKEKDKQIETLLQRSHEQNVIIQTLQEKANLLPSSKKRSFWRWGRS